jgi:DNA-binding CsgD family transcriptional regulator
MRAHHSSKKPDTEVSLRADDKDTQGGQLGVRVVLEELGASGWTVVAFDIPNVHTDEVSRAISSAFSGASMVVTRGDYEHELGRLGSALQVYSELRGLSGQQLLILRLYLNGQNDKEIAQALECAECTVYEHWRRMAKKAGGAHKDDVVTDFHRFLDRRAGSERDPTL